MIKMERKIDIQKVDGYGDGKKNCMVDVELDLDNDNFSACANVWNHRHSDVIYCGQCFDDLLIGFPELNQNEVFMEVYDLWKNYHLNNMHAGTPEQEKAIASWETQGHKYDYKEVCDYLKSINLYEVPVSTIDLEANPKYVDSKNKTYKYGHDWLKETIPERDIARIECLIRYEKVLEQEPSFEVADEIEL